MIVYLLRRLLLSRWNCNHINRQRPIGLNIYTVAQTLNWRLAIEPRERWVVNVWKARLVGEIINIIYDRRQHNAFPFIIRVPLCGIRIIRVGFV